MGEQAKEPSSTDSAAHNRISKAQRTGYILVIVGSCIHVLLYWLPMNIFHRLNIFQGSGSLHGVTNLFMPVGLVVDIFGMAMVVANANSQPRLRRLVWAIGGLPHILISFYRLVILIYACVKMGYSHSLPFTSDLFYKVISHGSEFGSITLAYLSLLIMAVVLVVKEKKIFQIFLAIATYMLLHYWLLWETGLFQSALLPHLMVIAFSIYAILMPNIPRKVPYSDFRS